MECLMVMPRLNIEPTLNNKTCKMDDVWIGNMWLWYYCSIVNHNG
jgi:hypothetical protein